MRKFLLGLVAALLFAGIAAPFVQTVRAEEFEDAAPSETEESGGTQPGGVLDAYHAFLDRLERPAKSSPTTLTIYCDSLDMIYFTPPSFKNLIGGNYRAAFVVENAFLRDYIDLFRQLTEDKLVPVVWSEEYLYEYAEIYYVFESEADGKVLEVGLVGIAEGYRGGYDAAVVSVNGKWYKMNPVFYEIIWPYLPTPVQEMYSPLLVDAQNQA